MYGALPHVLEGWAAAAGCEPPSSIVGTGLCMEGIEQNPLVYDLAAELAFRCNLCLPAITMGKQVAVSHKATVPHKQRSMHKPLNLRS